jgi:hypothetical protein
MPDRYHHTNPRLDALRSEIELLRGLAVQHDANTTAAFRSIVHQLSALAASQTDLAKTPALALTPAQFDREIAVASRRAIDLQEPQATALRAADRRQLQSEAAEQLAATASRWQMRCAAALLIGFALYPLITTFMPGGTCSTP